MASNTADRAPAANPTSSFWNSEPKRLDDYRSTPELPAQADVVIIGSGLSGVATAYFLLKDNPNPPSIVLLEARKICSGATGRNGGHVKPDTFSDISKFTKLFGKAATAELAAFEASHVYAVKDLVEKENLDCDFHITRALDVFLDSAHADEVQATFKSLSQTADINLADVAFTGRDDAERVSNHRFLFALYCRTQLIIRGRFRGSRTPNAAYRTRRLICGLPSWCIEYLKSLSRVGSTSKPTHQLRRCHRPETQVASGLFTRPAEPSRHQS